MTYIICPFDKQEFTSFSDYSSHVSNDHSGGMGFRLSSIFSLIKSLFSRKHKSPTSKSKKSRYLIHGN